MCKLGSFPLTPRSGSTVERNSFVGNVLDDQGGTRPLARRAKGVALLQHGDVRKPELGHGRRDYPHYAAFVGDLTDIGIRRITVDPVRHEPAVSGADFEAQRAAGR
jgi:hypothetical protein